VVEASEELGTDRVAEVAHAEAPGGDREGAGAVIALSIALVVVASLFVGLEVYRARMVEARAVRFDEAQARKARTAEAERLDALDARQSELAADLKHLNELVAARMIARR
jgi:hypothetical protein